METMTVYRDFSNPVIKVIFNINDVRIDMSLKKFEMELRERILRNMPPMRWVFSEIEAREKIEVAIKEAWDELLKEVKNETLKGKQ